LARAASRLGGPPSPIPALTLFTDPDRTPDPLRLIGRLPRGCAVVLRHFGRADWIAQAPEIARAARLGGHVLLVAADARLALEIGAAGVHWPQARLGEASRWRSRLPLMTAAVHDAGAIRRAGRRVDALFLSPVFPSRSPSAARPLGPWRAGALARLGRVPVHALGGVDHEKARRLAGLGFSGIACVEALASA